MGNEVASLDVIIRTVADSAGVELTDEQLKKIKADLDDVGERADNAGGHITGMHDQLRAAGGLAHTLANAMERGMNPQQIIRLTQELSRLNSGFGQLIAGIGGGPVLLAAATAIGVASAAWQHYSEKAKKELEEVNKAIEEHKKVIEEVETFQKRIARNKSIGELFSDEEKEKAIEKVNEDIMASDKAVEVRRKKLEKFDADSESAFIAKKLEKEERDVNNPRPQGTEVTMAEVALRRQAAASDVEFLRKELKEAQTKERNDPKRQELEYELNAALGKSELARGRYNKINEQHTREELEPIEKTLSLQEKQIDLDEKAAIAEVKRKIVAREITEQAGKEQEGAIELAAMRSRAEEISRAEIGATKIRAQKYATERLDELNELQGKIETKEKENNTAILVVKNEADKKRHEDALLALETEEKDTTKSAARRIELLGQIRDLKIAGAPGKKPTQAEAGEIAQDYNKQIATLKVEQAAQPAAQADIQGKLSEIALGRQQRKSIYAQAITTGDQQGTAAAQAAISKATADEQELLRRKSQLDYDKLEAEKIQANEEDKAKLTAQQHQLAVKLSKDLAQSSEQEISDIKGAREEVDKLHPKEKLNVGALRKQGRLGVEDQGKELPPTPIIPDVGTLEQQMKSALPKSLADLHAAMQSYHTDIIGGLSSLAAATAKNATEIKNIKTMMG